MKTFKEELFSLLAILAFTIFLTSCEQDGTEISGVMESETDLLNQQISELPTLNDMNLPTEEEYPSKLIATIQKDGHQIKFHSTGSPENSGIFMEESLYGIAFRNQEEYHLAKEEGTNPFDVFLALTDNEVSIPKAIANSAKDNLLELSGRKVMKTGKSLELLDAKYSEEEANIRYRGCSGDVGYENFNNWYCKDSQPWNINHCGADERSSSSNWYSIYKGQWQEHHNTRARVNNTCNDVRVYFYSYIPSFGRWMPNSTPLTRGPGNNYFSMWTSAKGRKLFVIDTPYPGTRYRSLVNFVK